MNLGTEHKAYMNRLQAITADEFRSSTRPSSPVLRPGAGRPIPDPRPLPDPGVEDKWWLSDSCKSFLETKGNSFGRKQIFLIQKKNDEPDLSPVGTDSDRPVNSSEKIH